MSVILMTTLLYKALILQGEIWCWSLLGLKWKDITASCFVPKSLYISTIFSSIIESIQNIVSLDPEPFRLLPGVFFQVYFHNFKWVQRLLYRPYFVVRRYYCLYVTVSRQTQLTLGNTLSIFGPFFFFNGCVTFPSCWAGRITGIEEKPGKIKQKEKYVGQTIWVKCSLYFTCRVYPIPLTVFCEMIVWAPKDQGIDLDKVIKSIMTSLFCPFHSSVIFFDRQLKWLSL